MELENKAGVEEFALPSPVFQDVTEDLFYTGGNLAEMPDEEFRRGLSQRLRNPENQS
jgi:hypothetical protein